MKRIKFACLEQTIHFELKEELNHDEGVALVRQEVEAYKQGLDRRHAKYRVEGEEEQPDGSVLLKIRKQYNTYPCGTYLA